MVAQKITCPSRSDDIGNDQYETNTNRYGFFANGCQSPIYFESGRAKSFKESKGERDDRKQYRRRPQGIINSSSAYASGHHKLFRGKGSTLIFLKEEPHSEETMFHETDSEFFRDLAPWCGQSAEGAVQTVIDMKKDQERAHNTDTLHTPISPQGWELTGVNSPSPCGSHFPALNDPLSPNVDMFTALDKLMYPEQDSLNWKIETMPVVIESGHLAPEESFDFNPCKATEKNISYDIHEYTPTNTTHNTFIMDEDSSDIKLDTVIPTEVEYNDVVISNYIIDNTQGNNGVLESIGQEKRRRPALRLNVPERTPWCGDVVSTPDIVDLVTQLDKEAHQLPNETQIPWPLQPDPDFTALDIPSTSATPSVDYEPLTPKADSLPDSEEDSKVFNTRKRPHDSEDSDEPYIPYVTSRSGQKKRKRKMHVPIKDLIQQLEQAQPKDHEKPRRGRPPNRRVSVVSSVNSVDDNVSSGSTHEMKYRELRDKNNEASKRSRMNRKLKELQMEQLAADLEERNKKLKVRADILEDMTKRMKEALMTAILQK